MCHDWSDKELVQWEVPGSQKKERYCMEQVQEKKIAEPMNNIKKPGMIIFKFEEKRWILKETL